MKYRNTIPVKPVYHKDEVVSNVKETAITQMVTNSLNILSSRIGNLHDAIDTESAKFITDLSRAIGNMSHITPPLDKAKLLVYAPYLYLKLKDCTYNVIPHPDQDKKCAVGCIYDHYDPATLEMKCANSAYADNYRQNPPTDLICCNEECGGWSGRPKTLHDVSELPDNIAVDTVRRYKIVFPSEQRLVTSALTRYYEDCGSEYGEPERGDASSYNEGDCSVVENSLDASNTYACQTDGKTVWYEFPNLSKNDAEYYLTLEFPGLGLTGVNVTVKIGPNNITWTTLDTVSVSGTEPTINQYEIPLAAYESTGTLYVQFSTEAIFATPFITDIKEPSWYMSAFDKYVAFSTCYPQQVPLFSWLGTTGTIYIADLETGNYVKLLGADLATSNVWPSSPSLNYDGTKIAFHSNWDAWNSNIPLVIDRSDIWTGTINITSDSTAVYATVVEDKHIFDAGGQSFRSPFWSKDSKFIVCIRTNNNGSEIFVVNVDTGAKYQITDYNNTVSAQAMCLAPSWHPTSKDTTTGNYNRILFSKADVDTIGIHYVVDEGTEQLYELMLTWAGDVPTFSFDRQITTHLSNGHHQYGRYSPNGLAILFDRQVAGRVGPDGNPAFDYYIMEAAVGSEDDPIFNDSNAVRLTTDDMGDSQVGCWSSDGTQIIMQSSALNTWEYDQCPDGPGTCISPGNVTRNEYGLYTISTSSYTGGFVSQIWVTEITKQNSFNINEQLFLPPYLSRITPYNEYPRNAVFVFDSVGGTTLDHIKCFSANFKHYEDCTLLHRDCVDVFLYNDQQLSVNDTQYLVYTTGTSLADVAGGLLDDYIHHVANPTMHLTAEEVCRIINNPSLCCKYDTNTATVTFNNSVGVHITGPAFRDEYDDYHVGEIYRFGMYAFGENTPSDADCYWYVISPTVGALQSVHKGAHISIAFDTIGTWQLRAEILVKLGDGSYNTIRASEEFTLYVKASNNPVEIDYLESDCLNAEACCDSLYNYTYLQYINGGVCSDTPDASYLVADFAFSGKFNTNNCQAGDTITLRYRLYVLDQEGTKIYFNDWTTYATYNENTSATLTKKLALSGSSVVNVNDPGPSPYNGTPIGYHIDENDGIVYGEFDFVTTGTTPEAHQIKYASWQVGFRYTQGMETYAGHRIQCLASRTCTFDGGHAYTNPGSIYNTMYYSANFPDADYVACGITYGLSQESSIIESIMTPILMFDDTTGLFELSADSWENISTVHLYLSCNRANSLDWYATLIDPDLRTLYVNMFDASVLDIRYSEIYHSLSPQNNPWTLVGISPYTYNAVDYNSGACYVCNTSLTHSPNIPNPDNWKGLDTGNTHTRSFNFYPIINIWDPCGESGAPCYVDGGVYKRGSGHYSMNTLKPCRNSSTFVDDEPQFGHNPGAAARSKYFLSMPERSVVLNENNPSGLYFIDITDDFKNMVKRYCNNPSIYFKPSRIGLRIRNPFPYNTTTMQDRYIIFGSQGNDIAALGINYVTT